MKTFKDLVFKEPMDLWDNSRARLYFPNGYGVSVVIGPYSYGGNQGLYELAVVIEETGDLTYNTPITDDVIGHLTPDEVTEIMQQVQELPTIV
jgi:hypothetical protein